jgi:hypothetical protein
MIGLPLPAQHARRPDETNRLADPKLTAGPITVQCPANGFAFGYGARWQFDSGDQAVGLSIEQR